MKNTINYYYNLNPNKINHIFDYYYFYIDNELYYFSVYTRNVKDIEAIYKFNQEQVLKDVLVSEIINNRMGTIITIVNQVPYILTKVNVNINKPIRLSEVSYLSNVHISFNWNTYNIFIPFNNKKSSIKFNLYNSSYSSSFNI